MRKIRQGTEEARAIFPVLCVVIALVFFSSMPVYRGLESNFSEEKGLGAAMVMLRSELEQNDTISAFLGLDAVSDSEDGAEKTDLAAAVAAYIEAHAPSAPAFVLPLDGEINSAHGTRINPFYRGDILLLEASDYETHHGIDISAARTRTVCAAMDGTVRKVAWDDSYGNYMIITHADCETLYAHCASISVGEGERVSAGDEIAEAGMTGRATGVHLHFEVLVDGISVDPCAYFGLFASSDAITS